MTGVEAACLEEMARTYQNGLSALPPRRWGRFFVRNFGTRKEFNSKLPVQAPDAPTGRKPTTGLAALVQRCVLALRPFVCLKNHEGNGFEIVGEAISTLGRLKDQ